MTASTPPPVDVIAEALRHQWYDATTDNEDPATGCAGCDDWFGDEYAVDDGTFAAHQARAVLDALTKAGGVEWGITWDGAMFDPLQANTLAAAKNVAASMAKITSDGAEPYVISRITGPWTVVEG